MRHGRGRRLSLGFDSAFSKNGKMAALRVRPEAELDGFEAALWYEKEREGLGLEFLEAVRVTFTRVEEGPKHFPVITGDMRRAIVKRFPYGVFFVIDVEGPVVVAVMDLRRHPSSWERRR